MVTASKPEVIVRSLVVLGALTGLLLMSFFKTDWSTEPLPTPGGVWTTRSNDGGRTWATPTTDTRYHEQASDLLPVREGGRRLMLHTWGDRSGAFGPGRPTVGQVIRPDGTRLAPKLIYTGGAHDESYPSSVQVGPGTFFTVFYDAARGIIGGTYSRLTEYLMP